MEENLGKIVHNGRIYDLDDPTATEKLEGLLEILKQEEEDLKKEIDANIQEDLEERE